MATAPGSSFVAGDALSERVCLGRYCSLSTVGNTACSGIQSSLLVELPAFVVVTVDVSCASPCVLLHDTHVIQHWSGRWESNPLDTLLPRQVANLLPTPRYLVTPTGIEPAFTGVKGQLGDQHPSCGV